MRWHWRQFRWRRNDDWRRRLKLGADILSTFPARCVHFVASLVDLNEVREPEEEREGKARSGRTEEHAVPRFESA